MNYFNTVLTILPLIKNTIQHVTCILTKKFIHSRKFIVRFINGQLKKNNKSEKYVQGILAQGSYKYIFVNLYKFLQISQFYI